MAVITEQLLGMLYIRNITASFLPPMETPPNYIEQAMPWFFVFVTLEAIILRLKGREWNLSDATVSTSQGLAQEVIRLTLRGCEGWAYVCVWQHWRWFDVPWDSPLSFWLTMLGVDFGYYWFHRASHEVNLVWASHQVHHSSEYYNLTTALRQSVVQQYFSWVVYLPLALLGVAPSMFFTHVQFNFIYQFWIHTEIVKSLGPLEHVLNTPSHHRVHHGSNVKYLDKNYGGVLIIWDRIFGTFCWEEETPTYGRVHKIESYDLWPIQLAHFRWTLVDLRQQVGWRNKLRRLVYGPNWMAGTGRFGDRAAIPDVDPARPRFDRAGPLWLQLYTALHMLLLLVPSTTFAQQHLTLPPLGVLLYSGQLLLGLSCVGWLLDGVRWAPLAELVRCALGLVSLAWLSGQYSAAAVTAGRAVLAASMLLWLGAVTNGLETARVKTE